MKPSILAIGKIAMFVLSKRYFKLLSLSNLSKRYNKPSVPAGSLPCSPPLNQTFKLFLFSELRNTMGI